MLDFPLIVRCQNNDLVLNHLPAGTNKVFFLFFFIVTNLDSYMFDLFQAEGIVLDARHALSSASGLSLCPHPPGLHCR